MPIPDTRSVQDCDLKIEVFSDTILVSVNGIKELTCGSRIVNKPPAGQGIAPYDPAVDLGIVSMPTDSKFGIYA